MPFIKIPGFKAIDNPLDGVLPDFTIFGAEFTELWQKILAGIWGIAIIVSIVFLIMGILSMSAAGDNPQAHKEARKRALMGGVGLAGLAALAVIVGAVLAFVG